MRRLHGAKRSSTHGAGRGLWLGAPSIAAVSSLRRSRRRSGAPRLTPSWNVESSSQSSCRSWCSTATRRCSFRRPADQRRRHRLSEPHPQPPLTHAGIAATARRQQPPPPAAPAAAAAVIGETAEREIVVETPTVSATSDESGRQDSALAAQEPSRRSGPAGRSRAVCTPRRPADAILVARRRSRRHRTAE